MMTFAQTRAATIVTARKDSRIAEREAEIAAVQRDLDRALEAARHARQALDRATRRAQIAALRDIGVVNDDDAFSDEPGKSNGHER
jgi:hypothetical protein